MRKWLLSVLFVLPIIVVDNAWIPRPTSGSGVPAGPMVPMPKAPPHPAPAPHK